MKKALSLLAVAAGLVALLVVLLRGSPGGAPGPVAGPDADATRGPTAAPDNPPPAAAAAPRETADPDGGVLVLHDRAPATATVRSADVIAGSWESPGWLGETGLDGRLARRDFLGEPRRLVMATAPGLVAPPVPWREEGVVLELGEGPVVAGRVLDGEGRPVRGALVTGSGGRALATSGADGRYRLAGLTPLSPREVEARVLDGGFPVTVEVEITSWNDPVERDLVLDVPPAAGVLAVVEIAGRPAARPELRWEGPWGEGETPLPRAGGEIRLPPFPPGAEVRLVAACPGFRTAEALVTAPEQDELREVRLRLEPGGVPAFGRVTDAEGRSVPGAAVIARERPYVGARTLGSATADREGRFPIRTGWLGGHALAWVPGEASSGWTELTASAGDVVLALGPGATVEGRVVDRETGEPVPKVPVHLRLEPSEHGELWSTRTDPEGRYRFEGVPTGSFARPMVADAPRAWNPDPTPGARRPKPTELVRMGRARWIEESGEVFRCDLPVETMRGATILLRAEVPEEVGKTARVVWEHAFESADATRSFTKESGKRAEDGIFTLDRFLPVGTNRIDLRVGRFTGTTGEILVARTGDLGEREVVLEAHPRIVARLVDGDGARVRRAGVWVEVYERPGRPGRPAYSFLGGGTTDGDGRAAIDGVLPGEEDLRHVGASILAVLAGKALYAARPGEETVNLEMPGREVLRRTVGGADLVLDVPLLGPRPVTIRTVDPEGEAVPGVRLTLGPLFPAHPRPVVEAEAVTGADGRVTVHALIDPWDLMACRIEARPPFAGSYDPFDDDLGEGNGEVELVFEVRRGRAVRIRLVDDEGRPAVGVEATVGQDSCRLLPTLPAGRPRTDRDGVIETFVPEGEAQLVLFSEDFFDVGSVIVPAGATEVVHRVRRLAPVRVRIELPKELAAARSLDVSWEVEEGGLRPSGRAYARRAGPGRLEGVLRLPRLPRLLTAESDDLRWWSRAEVGPREDEVVLALVPRPTHEVVLLLVDDEGEPIADVAVLPVREPGDPRAAFLPRLTRTDSSGRIVLTLPAGRGYVELRTSKGHFNTGIGFAVPAPEPVRVEMRGP